MLFIFLFYKRNFFQSSSSSSFSFFSSSFFYFLFSFLLLPSLCFSLSWSNIIKSNVKNGGDILIYGSFPTLAQGNGRNVQIYYQEYTGTTPYWSYGATLVANLTNKDGSHIVGIGESLSAGKGLLTLDILLASAPQNNTVFVFQDTRTHWTQKQALVATDSEKNDYFGFDVAIDVLNPRKAIISAPYDDDNGLSSGSAYIFVSTPSGTSWTLTQKLRSEYITPNGNFGNEVAIFDNKIAVSAPGSCEVYLYSEQPTLKDETPFWSEQQVLYYPNCGGFLTISQYDNDLVIGSPTYSTNSGQVYLLQSKTYRGECDGDFMPHNINFNNLLTYDELIEMKELKKLQFQNNNNNNNNNNNKIQKEIELNLKLSNPKPICEVTRWSQTQSLTVSNNLCGYFGSNVAIYEDVLVVSNLDTSNSCPSVVGNRNTRLLVYERNPTTNTWSLSQTYTDPVKYSTSGLGTNGISLYGTSFVAGTVKGYNRVYSFTSSGINCVYVTFEDKFGDGWSNVDLLITNTEDYTERYSLYCDSVSNPRSMRYCPLNIHNYEGKSFKFEIADPISHPYHHEIRWRITPELTNVAVYGDIRTKMEVTFDGTSMIVFRGTDVLENEIKECENECRSEFEPSSSNMVVLPITLYDSLGKAWQDVYDGGTSYIITDRKGKKVYVRGTLCAATLRQTCYIELPYDEKFSIRVSGALDSRKGDHTWSFCGMTGSSVDHISFITSSSSTQACWVEEDYTQGTYCNSVLHAIPLHGILLFHGLHNLKSLSILDETVLSSSLTQLFRSTSPLSTTYQYSYDDYYHALKVEFVTFIPAELYGLDGLDPDNLHNAYEIAANILTSGVHSGQLVENIENYIASHSGDNLNYGLYDHGFIELQSVEEERTWRNYLPVSSSPSPFYYELPSIRPTPIPSPSPNMINPVILSHSNSKNENSEPIISSPIIIGLFVVIGVVMMIYLANKSSSKSNSKSKSKGSISSSSSIKNKNNKKIRDENQKNYHELSTSSHHKKDPLYDDDNDNSDSDDDEDDDENQNNNKRRNSNRHEKDDIESICFTECIELDDNDNDDNNINNRKKNRINNNRKNRFSRYGESDSDEDSNDDEDDDNDDEDENYEEEMKITKKNIQLNPHQSPTASIRKLNTFQPLKKNHNPIQKNGDGILSKSSQSQTQSQSQLQQQNKNKNNNNNNKSDGPIIIRKIKK